MCNPNLPRLQFFEFSIASWLSFLPPLLLLPCYALSLHVSTIYNRYNIGKLKSISHSNANPLKSTVEPPIMNSPNSEKALIMKFFQCMCHLHTLQYICTSQYRKPPNSEKKLAVPKLSSFGGSTVMLNCYCASYTPYNYVCVSY